MQQRRKGSHSKRYATSFRKTGVLHGFRRNHALKKKNKNESRHFLKV